MFIIIITLLIAVLIMEFVNFQEAKEQLYKILPINNFLSIITLYLINI
jgi:hypothetical protein